MTIEWLKERGITVDKVYAFQQSSTDLTGQFAGTRGSATPIIKGSCRFEGATGLNIGVPLPSLEATNLRDLAEKS